MALILFATSCTDQLGTQADIAALQEQVHRLSEENTQLRAELFDATSSTTTTAVPVVRITGTFTVLDSGGIDGYLPWTEGEACWGRRGYDDIREGTEVVVRDGEGKTLSVGRLTAGKFADPPHDCEFSFEVAVPSDSDFYQIAVSHRGSLTYSNQEMRNVGWIVALEL